MEVRYTEGPDAVDVPLPDGGEMRVERGAWADLPRELVQGDAGLVAQGWESRTAESRTAKKTKESEG